MFGRKSAEVKRLEQENATLQSRLHNWENATYPTMQSRINVLEASELKLMGQIREMDQLIFQMGQQTDWANQHGYFLQLQAQTERRMKLESDRIATLLIPEMQKAYR
jgi:nucleoside-specific outer membrane channel protein Tsx